jgi:hypothetical protein
MQPEPPETPSTTANSPPNTANGKTQEPEESKEENDESDSTLKDSDREAEYDPNEIFYTKVTRTKRNRKNSPKKSNKKARQETGVALGKSRMFKV